VPSSSASVDRSARSSEAPPEFSAQRGTNVARALDRLVVRTVVVVALATLPAFGHGGVYRGPGAAPTPAPSPVLPTPRPATTPAPSVAGLGKDTSTWSQWWHLNRDRYLRLKELMRPERGATAGSDEFFLGLGVRGEPVAAGRPSARLIASAVLPVLERAVREETSPDLLSAALIALAKIGDDGYDFDFATLLRSRLVHGNQEVHEAAVLALGILGSASSAPTLVDLLHGTERGAAVCERRKVPRRTRAFAAYGLGLVGRRATSRAVREYVVHHLLQQVEREPEGEAAVACALALGLVPLEWSTQADVPRSQTSGPSRLDQVQRLRALFDDSDCAAGVRVAAGGALARLAAGSSDDLRLALVEGFARQLKAKARAPRQVRQAAVQALGALVSPTSASAIDVRARERLLAGRARLDGPSRHLASIAVARSAARAPDSVFARDVRDFLLERLSRGTTPARPWAALALGLLEERRLAAGHEPDPVVRRALRATLRNAKSAGDVGAACTALGLAADLEASELLIARLAAGGDDQRAEAAIGLGLMGARAALPALREVVESANYRPQLLREASIALALLHDRGAVELLIKRLTTSDTVAERAALCSALGIVGDVRSVEPLLAQIAERDASGLARAFAVVALGNVCDKNGLPWNEPYAAHLTWVEAPATLFDPVLGKGIVDLF